MAQVPYTVEFTILDGADDAEEAIPSGAMNLTSSDLEMTMEGTEQIIGLRFNNINIPQGATINSAYIQFTTDETDDVATSLVINGELTENSTNFTNTLFDISNRTTTSAAVNWDNIPAWDQVGEAGPDQATPDLTTIVEEILNQGGWASGNAMTFIVTGTGKRNAISFNNGANMPARLIINYDVTEFPVEAFPINESALWKFNDSGMDLGTNWIELNYDDSAWDFGQGQLGYGDGDEASTLEFGGDPNNKFITYYFRKTVTVADPGVFDSLTLRVLRDDGAVVYINGEEVIRTNMPAGNIDYLTTASNAIGGSEEDTYFAFQIANNLVAGENIIAVEIHQANSTSSDISFDLSLDGNILLPPAIQLIHGSADPSLEFVDVYIDAFNLGNWVKFNGTTPIPYLAGTPYLTDLPPGTHGIAISPFLQNDFMWSATTFTLEVNKRYIAMVSGVRDTANFEKTFNSGEAIQFKIQVNEVPGNEGVGSTECLPLLFHGTTDLPNIRLIAVGAGDATADFPEGLPYGFDLLGGTVDALPYPLVQVTNNEGTAIYSEHKVDLIPFTQQVVTIFTSGFYTADGDAGVDDANYNLYLMPEVGGLAIPMPAPDPPQPGKIQIIHDSPDPELSEVDIWVNGQKEVEALGFREATAFVDIEVGINRVAVAPHSTTMADTAWSAMDVLVEADLDVTTFQAVGRTYTAVAHGARNTAPFENPVNADVSFGVAVSEARSEAAVDTLTDLRFFHGATNGPVVDAILEGQIIPIVNDLEYSNYSPIYVTLPAGINYQVNLTDAMDNSAVLFGYDLDLTDQGGKALIVLASGILNPDPDQPAFGLFIIDADGGPATPLELVLSNTEEAVDFGNVQVFPNPMAEVLTISGKAGFESIRLINMEGKVLRFWKNTPATFEVKVSELPEALYFLELSSEGENWVIPVVKK